MALPIHFLTVYGYALLFAWVLVQQLGVPVPSAPVLLAAGTLSAQGVLSLPLVFVAALTAAVISDSTWFCIGRRYGHVVLRVLCKMSLEPTTCVRRTQDSFGRMHGPMLLWAKFVPGVAMLAPPVAGENGMSLAPFLFFDGMGSAFWAGGWILAGRLFGDALRRDPRLLAWAARFSGALLLAAIAAVLAGRILRRRAVLRELAAARLEPVELKRLLDAGERVYIVDLRHPLELLPEPYTLPGALHFAPDTLTRRHSEIPRDRDVVLFCTCPSEATAAKTAMTLHKLGIERVRPLRGGYDEWKRLGFPLDVVPLERAYAALHAQA